MTEKGSDLLQAMVGGKKLYEFKSVIIRNVPISYKLNQKTIHSATVRSLIKEDFLMRGSSTKTLGGWKTELILKH